MRNCLGDFAVCLVALAWQSPASDAIGAQTPIDVSALWHAGKSIQVVDAGCHTRLILSRLSSPAVQGNEDEGAWPANPWQAQAGGFKTSHLRCTTFGEVLCMDSQKLGQHSSGGANLIHKTFQCICMEAVEADAHLLHLQRSLQDLPATDL